MTPFQRTRNLHDDLLEEYGSTFVKSNDGSFEDTLLDLAQSEYEKECDLLDKKMADWVTEKIKEIGEN